jgi:hypothetical protein
MGWANIVAAFTNVGVLMALASIVATWLVLYTIQRSFKDPVVKIALGLIALSAMNCLIQFAILQVVDVYMAIGTAVIFGFIGWCFAFFATRKTEPAIKPNKVLIKSTKTKKK